GESAQYIRENFAEGPSPRVRGRGIKSSIVLVYERSIPARAGERPARYHCPRGSRVHPRACGGEPLALRTTLGRKGPSPRVRGRGTHVLDTVDDRRSIPARAGESRHLARAQGIRRVHPRACGGESPEYQALHSAYGPSPRVRGRAFEAQLVDAH